MMHPVIAYLMQISGGMGMVAGALAQDVIVVLIGACAIIAGVLERRRALAGRPLRDE